MQHPFERASNFSEMIRFSNFSHNKQSYMHFEGMQYTHSYENLSNFNGSLDNVVFEEGLTYV